MSAADEHGATHTLAPQQRTWRRTWRRTGRQTLPRKLGIVSFVVFCLALSLLWANQRWPLPLPGPEAYSQVIAAANGEPLRRFADEQGVWRYPVTLDEVSPRYVEALIHYEDRYFWQHPGVNPLALLRASWQAVKHGEIISGGSTLSMQVARLLDPQPRSLAGKFRQMLRALQLEWQLSKTEILELYLNHAPFGGTIEGVQAASYVWLGKPANSLSHAEAALLAVLPQAPSRLRPDRHPQRAQQARDKVLDRLSSFDIWPKETVTAAKLETVFAWPQQAQHSAPLLARRIYQRQATSGRAHTQQAAADTTTFIDINLQQALEAWLKDRVHLMPAGVSAAVLVMRNDDLAVRAYLGSADFSASNRFAHVDMVTATRSPGSTLKPFLYGLALDAGLIHSASLLVDGPQDYAGYRPSNFAGDYRGPVTVSTALQQSLNVPAVSLLEHYGAKRFVSSLANGGLRLQLPAGSEPNLATILGGAGTQLEALVGSYRALAAGGLAGKPRLQASEPISERRLFSAEAAWIIHQTLASQARPDQLSLRRSLQTRPWAWKTGTSYGYRDAWAIGAGPSHTVGVWIGRPDNTPTPGHYGAVTAAPLLFDVFERLNEPVTELPQPKAVSKQAICWPLGLAATATPAEHCHETQQAWTIRNTTPPTLPSRQANWASNPISIRIAEDSGQYLPPDCQLETVNSTTKQIARWPLRARPWLNPPTRQRSEIPATHPACPRAVASQAERLSIIDLPAFSELRLPPGEQGLPSIDLRSLGGHGQTWWLLNGVVIASGPAGELRRYQFERPGQFELTALDSNGRYDSVSIHVTE